MRRFIALALGLCMAISVAAPTLAARQTEPVSGMDTLTSLVSEGRCWMSDGINHCRGWTGMYITTGDPLVAGTSIVVANWNMDAYGNGTLWGTADVTLADETGGWHQSWVAKMEAGLWAGPAVGRGWGSLEGLQLRSDVWSLGPGIDQFEGFIFEPGG